jgi:hypothetical protein
MDAILALILGFLLGFLGAGYLHYRRCRKQGMTRMQAIAAMVGGGGGPQEP